MQCVRTRDSRTLNDDVDVPLGGWDRKAIPHSSSLIQLLDSSAKVLALIDGLGVGSTNLQGRLQLSESMEVSWNVRDPEACHHERQLTFQTVRSDASIP